MSRAIEFLTALNPELLEEAKAISANITKVDLKMYVEHFERNVSYNDLVIKKGEEIAKVVYAVYNTAHHLQGVSTTQPMSCCITDKIIRAAYEMKQTDDTEQTARFYNASELLSKLIIKFETIYSTIEQAVNIAQRVLSDKEFALGVLNGLYDAALALKKLGDAVKKQLIDDAWFALYQILPMIDYKLASC